MNRFKTWIARSVCASGCITAFFFFSSMFFLWASGCGQAMAAHPNAPFIIIGDTLFPTYMFVGHTATAQYHLDLGSKSEVIGSVQYDISPAAFIERTCGDEKVTQGCTFSLRYTASKEDIGHPITGKPRILFNGPAYLPTADQRYNIHVIAPHAKLEACDGTGAPAPGGFRPTIVFPNGSYPNPTKAYALYKVTNDIDMPETVEKINVLNDTEHYDHSEFRLVDPPGQPCVEGSTVLQPQESCYFEVEYAPDGKQPEDIPLSDHPAFPTVQFAETPDWIVAPEDKADEYQVESLVPKLAIITKNAHGFVPQSIKSDQISVADYLVYNLDPGKKSVVITALAPWLMDSSHYGDYMSIDITEPLYVDSKRYTNCYTLMKGMSSLFYGDACAMRLHFNPQGKSMHIAPYEQENPGIRTLSIDIKNGQRQLPMDESVFAQVESIEGRIQNHDGLKGVVPSDVQKIAISDDGKYIFVETSHTLMVSDNGGSTWKEADKTDKNIGKLYAYWTAHKQSCYTVSTQGLYLDFIKRDKPFIAGKIFAADVIQLGEKCVVCAATDRGVMIAHSHDTGKHWNWNVRSHQ